MQPPPPPPAGCTDTAPPAAGGATDELAMAAGAAGARPAAKTNAATQPHSAARAATFGVPIRHNGTCPAVDAPVMRRATSKL